MIVITGGSKGIGRAIIEHFAAKGHHIATCSRQLAALESLKADVENKYNVKVFIKTADLSVRKDIEDFAQFVKEIGQPIDALVNNAGVFVPGALHNEPEGTLERLIETNLYSAYHLTRAFINEMITRKKGHIFNIASIASFMAYANGGSYAISKHALLGFSRCLREEMKPHQVKVTTIMPGATLTDSWAGVNLPPERFATADDIAQIVITAFSLSGLSVVEDVVIRPQLGDI